MLLVLLAALYRVSLPTPMPGVFDVHRATASLPLDPQTPARAVSLPHVLDDEGPAWWGRVDYVVPWPQALGEPTPSLRRLALLIPRAGMGMRVLLNGEEIYRFGWEEPASRTVNATWFPHLVLLPQRLLAERGIDNELTIQVQAQVLERSGLWPVHIGNADLLIPRYQTLYFWQVTGTWMMAIVSLLVGILALVMWRALRERLFLLGGIASLAHAVRMVLSVVPDLPLPYDTYFLIHRVSFSVYAGFFILTVEELFGHRLRWVRLAAWALVVVAPFWMLGILLAQDYSLYRVWAGTMATLAGVSLTWAVVDNLRRRQFSDEHRLVVVVAAFTLITAVRDFLVVQLNFPGDADLRWTTIGGSALMLTMGWVLVDRATAWARTVHRLNDTLAETVAQREAELRTAFQRLQAAERQRVAEEERRRLMRDMHDGLGSQLVQTLNMVRSAGASLDRASVEAMLAQALDELRLTLDSFEPMEGDLPAILGTLRRRLGPALEAAGIELRWEVQDVPPVEALDSRGVMHLFRCLQEIFANVVKHAGAQRITVSTWQRDEHIVLSVEDDGVGMPPPQARQAQGRGLRNVLTRAAKIGAEVRFYDAHPGTGVELAFPRHGPTPESDSDWWRHGA
ncbi:sensor histidine kinase [Tepidimonas sp.]|uniref:sensor histidine kinase n=1 Tax=Tepidimonas sp. TaxID=2002775 RepID=UPI003918F61B